MKKFILPETIKIDNSDSIEEAYEVLDFDGYTLINLSLSFENIEKSFLTMAKKINAPAFIVIEVPNKDAMDIYYMEDVEYSKLFKIYNKYRDIILKEPMMKFGYGSMEGYDEVILNKFKILDVITEKPEKYLEYINRINLIEKEPVKTILDLVTLTNPIQFKTDFKDKNGKSINDMINELKFKGLYYIETKIDY